jgi:hypothetical protein
MEHQVRIATIAPGRMDEYVSAWTANVARLRRRHGFTIRGAWIIEETNEFVWLLGYDGDDGFAAADKRYLESEERSAVDNSPAEWIIESRSHAVRKVV